MPFQLCTLNAATRIKLQFSSFLLSMNSFLNSATRIKKVHVILTYNGENKFIKKDVPYETDELSHVYTFVLKRISSAIVTIESKPIGILTSKDVSMRVLALGLSPESTTVERDLLLLLLMYSTSPMRL